MILIIFELQTQHYQSGRGKMERGKMNIENDKDLVGSPLIDFPLGAARVVV